jgi:hypothetical protein
MPSNLQSAFFLALGTLLITAGIVLAAKPKIIEWIAENQNKRTAQWLADRGFRKFLDEFPQEVRRMKIFMPAGFVVVGVGFCIFAFTS